MSDRRSTMEDLSRREFLKKSAGAAGGLVLAQTSHPQATDPGSRRRPNFVFVMTDGHRPSALSLAGNPIVKTPNFDRIGREGYKLIHYYEEPQEFELYDLQEDPGELRNLYGDSHYAQLARELMNRITELRRETRD